MKWLKPDELRVSGRYVMTRTDDAPNSGCLIVLTDLHHDVKPGVRSIDEVSRWDEQCRFLGPLPAIDEPKRTFPSQVSTQDQLREAVILCNRNYLYDAADWIQARAFPER